MAARCVAEPHRQCPIVSELGRVAFPLFALVMEPPRQLQLHAPGPSRDAMPWV